jgi:glucosamine-phosphate N-acetyltransferase
MPLSPCSCRCHSDGADNCKKCTSWHKAEKYITDIRELQIDDIDNGFLETLDSLKPGTSNIKKEDAKKRFVEMDNTNFKIFVALSGKEVVSTISLIVEPKFINNLGIAGHIEDVATKETFKRKGIGFALLLYVLDYAKKQGCYKTILNCEEDVVPFYKNAGMKVALNAKGSREFEMRYNHTD